MRATSSGRPKPAFLRFEFSKRALYGQRGANRAFGIVLLRDRVPKQRHQTVAELLGDTPTHLGDRLRRGVEIGADQIAPILGVEPRGETRRVDKIAEHHSDRAMFRRGLRSLAQRIL